MQSAVLHSDWLTQGRAIDRFEQAVADYCGVKYAIAVSSATAALHIACLAIGLGEQDYLWTSQILLWLRQIVVCIAGLKSIL